MAKRYNYVALQGNVAGDPEQRSDKAPVVFSIFCDNGMDRDKKEDSFVIKVNVWGKTGEVVMSYAKKGSAVIVAGNLRQERWEKDGEKFQQMVVNAMDVTLIGGKKDDTPSEPKKESKTQPSPSQFDEDDDIPF